MAETILHLAEPDNWAAAIAAGTYTMSTRGRTLAEEGFIHCSRPEQVEGVANAFYADLECLVALTIDTELVGAPIVDEPPVPGSQELFPHIYGPLPVTAVVSTLQWTRSSVNWIWNGDAES
ncbi:MAG: DUF952 domain-containing protein [Ilumatobacteraceae bacterium]